ncbi:Hypothetical predicted protein [Octopus vulgaris]|uniref:Uncharacterized protein n=1 Tax=Octopus vulgaris TaxID=6645 RepID=A0AA36BC58_OCTVU|nr:Hypothetical predicted protein [Octopus vulgaris]
MTLARLSSSHSKGREEMHEEDPDEVLIEQEIELNYKVSGDTYAILHINYLKDVVLYSFSITEAFLIEGSGINSIKQYNE